MVVRELGQSIEKPTTDSPAPVGAFDSDGDLRSVVVDMTVPPGQATVGGTDRVALVFGNHREVTLHAPAISIRRERRVLERPSLP
jgi:hypothetical protein